MARVSRLTGDVTKATPSELAQALNIGTAYCHRCRQYVAVRGHRHPDQLFLPGRL